MDASRGAPAVEDGPFDMVTTPWRRRAPRGEATSGSAKATSGGAKTTIVNAKATGHMSVSDTAVEEEAEACPACRGEHKKHTCHRSPAERREKLAALRARQAGEEEEEAEAAAAKEATKKGTSDDDDDDSEAGRVGPSTTMGEFVRAARRAARMKRRHTELKRNGVLDTLHDAAASEREAAMEAAAAAYESGADGSRCFWVHPPQVLPDGGGGVGGTSVGGAAARSPGRARFARRQRRAFDKDADGAEPSSAELVDDGPRMLWVMLDGQQSEEEAEAEAAALVEAEAAAEVEAARERELAKYSKWLPRPLTVRGQIMRALRVGIYDREGICAFFTELPSETLAAVHGSSIVTSISSDKPGGSAASPGSSGKTSLRAAVVTSLGKEKVMKVPLFEQACNPPLPWPSVAFHGLPWPSMFHGLPWPSMFHGFPWPSCPSMAFRGLPRPLLSEASSV